VQALGSDALLVQANVASLEDLNRMVDATLERYDRIDLLVNNAGVGPRQRVDLLSSSVESYDEVMGINLRGPFFLTQRVANEMITRIQTGKMSTARIVNIGSISAYTSSPSRAEYCISKAGMGMLTKVFRRPPGGIRHQRV
jgi:3-oxoacyl-[acyl-carrier protein] reductase